MEKVTKFLEQNVQWVAIGLGAAFALWMAWGYVVNAPASVQVDGQTFTAGQVDRHTADSVAADLKGKVESNATVAMKVPRPADRFLEAMAWKGAADEPLRLVMDSKPPEVWKKPTTPGPGQPPGPGQQTQQDPNAPVAMGEAVLVIPPTGTPDEVRVGRSAVTIPLPQVDPNQQQIGPDGQPIAGAQPPAQPPPPPQGVDASGQPLPVDKEWVTQSFKISMAELDKAFVAAKIPVGQLRQTAFLHVEIVRQELDANNKPIGPETPVKGLDVSATGQPVLPYPGDSTEKSAQQALAAYEQWAIQNTQQILQPPFYTVVKGDQWVPPGTEIQAQQSQWTLDNPPPNWKEIPEWYDAVMKHRQIQAKTKAEEKRRTVQPRQSGPRERAPRGPGSGAEGEAGFAPRDLARPAVPPRVGPGDVFPGGEFEGGMGGPMAPNMPQPGTAYPNGMFDPANWKIQPAIQVWNHDVDVIPGKTYQYRMRYRIRNPLFNVGGNVAKNPKDTQILACVSEWSTWSKPVPVPAKTNFYVARGVREGTSVTFQVFKWEEGQQHSEMFSVNPGDQLGTAKNNIDFATGWYLVGVQGDNVLLSDKDGKLMIRNEKNDTGDPLFKQLKGLVDANKLLQQQQNPGGAAGIPPVGGGAIPIPR